MGKWSYVHLLHECGVFAAEGVSASCFRKLFHVQTCSLTDVLAEGTRSRTMEERIVGGDENNG